MLPKTPATQTTGLILTRMVIPLWILMGVVFKLWSGSPGNLPGSFVEFGRWLEAAITADIDVLWSMLYTLIGLEILAIGVMVLLARFAKPMAIFMLSVFCLILIGEMARGAESCGCFGGGVEIKPWQMLIADGVLLVLVALFPVKVAEEAWGFSKAIPAALGLGVLGMAISFGGATILHGKQTEQAKPDVTENGELDPTVNPNPSALPSQYWTRNLDDWVGKPWREVRIFQLMPRWPSGMDEGTRHVIFYSRTCVHCEEMFLDDIEPYPTIQEEVVAVEIPASRTRVTAEQGAWPMPEMDHVEFLELPLGPEWIIQSPLIVTVEDGVVICVNEGAHRECMDW